MPYYPIPNNPKNNYSCNLKKSATKFMMLDYLPRIERSIFHVFDSNYYKEIIEIFFLNPSSFMPSYVTNYKLKIGKKKQVEIRNKDQFKSLYNFRKKLKL